MAPTEMREHLRRAQVEIQLVESTLNHNHHSCPACGLTVREDFSEYQLREQLKAMREKLERLISSLKGKAAVVG